MKEKRAGAAFGVALAVHVVGAVLLANIVFHYDFSSLHAPRPIVAPPERLVYVDLTPRGGSGAVSDTGGGPARLATTPSTGLVAPLTVPTAIAPASPAAGTPGGTATGTGRGGGVGIATGIVPGIPDPRLASDPRAFYPLPKSHAQRVDSAVHASIYAYNDSVARAAANAGREPGDWTFERNGRKWGVDGNKIYLGKFAIPSAVLAALPIHIQGNPGEALTDRLSTTRRGDLLQHASSQLHDDEFKSAVKRIRERKDRERQERLGGDPDKSVTAPE